MAMYSATDGLPNDFHLVHLGARALGGAALVFGEMTCVSPDARITPGCLGLWNDEQAAQWKRIVDFVHRADAGEIRHPVGPRRPQGRDRASPGRAWTSRSPCSAWPLISASALPYLPQSQTPRAMERADMDRVVADFVAATKRAAATGADWLELHCAHGYLLSSFLSPLTNKRADEYGGDHEGPREIPARSLQGCARKLAGGQADVRAPVLLTTGTTAGNAPEDAAIFAAMFKEAGADLVDCSAGQVTKDEQPVYGRMFQTPFSDKIRNEVGIATIAVGAISELDQANSIIGAGRADLCAVARPHLADPAWLLHEAAKLGVADLVWPKQYLSGKMQFEAGLQRAATAAK
ncbi:MAG: hypothetical protein V9G24_05310 [Rhodoblastus sp.]